jgi:DNA repair protein RadC
MTVKSETKAKYRVNPVTKEGDEEAIISLALQILEKRIRMKPFAGHEMTSPQSVRDYLHLALRELEHEEFHCLWLDSQHRLIQRESMFRGTLDMASVYPREVVKAALRHNAGAVILAHNHPSGLLEPSEADKAITRKLKEVLSLIGVNVLDHFIVGDGQPYSFAEHGLC